MNFFPIACSSIVKNTNDYINVNLTDDSGNPVNITGYTFYFTLKSNPSYSDASASIAKVQTDHTNPVGGQTSFPILPSDTTNLLPGKYYYSISSVDPSNNYTQWSSGALWIEQSILNNPTL